MAVLTSDEGKTLPPGDDYSWNVVLKKAYIGAGVAQAAQCLTTGWTIGVRSSTEAEDFFSSSCVQTGSGAHPASYSVGTGGKARPGRDADHSPPSNAEIRCE
jgi:hypothetical protein